jgi:hypothetical protein
MGVVYFKSRDEGDGTYGGQVGHVDHRLVHQADETRDPRGITHTGLVRRALARLRARIRALKGP